jgi:hypothetical protein
MFKAILGFVLVCSLYSVQCLAIVFGQDDRREVYSSPYVNSFVSPSIALMASPVFLKDHKDGYEMDFNSISDSYEEALCKEEKFYNQPTASVNCTGFLVAPDLIMTAGHCMTAVNTEVKNSVTPHCGDFLWIFDYKYDSLGVIKKVFPFQNVAKCKEVVYAKFDFIKRKAVDKALGYGDDIALVRLDRSVGRPFLTFNSKINMGDSVYTVGYPTGLPQKITTNGIIKSVDHDNFFTTNLDILSGNSGSPVFNKKNQVLGVVVRAFPSDDYTYSNKRECSVVYKCTEDIKGCVVSQEDQLEVQYSHIQKASNDVLSLITQGQFLMN